MYHLLVLPKPGNNGNIIITILARDDDPVLQCFRQDPRVICMCIQAELIYIDTPTSLRVWDSIGAFGGFCLTPTKPISSSNFHEIHSVDAIQQIRTSW